MSREWDIVYKKARAKDGTLLFPERLSNEFLDEARMVMGSYFFANQYQNEIIPDDTQLFKREWIRYWQDLPKRVNTFAFFDPAISLEDVADFTGVTVVSVDTDGNRYVRYANKMKVTPTQMIDIIFKINAEYKPMAIGIETVAFQESLLYMLDQECRRRGQMVPIKGIKHGNDDRKDLRIASLVPYFEWGRYYLKQGLVFLEDELLTFPRGAHDDIIDSLSSMEKIIVQPSKESQQDAQPNPANADEYEKWFRRKGLQQRSRAQAANENFYD